MQSQHYTNFDGLINSSTSDFLMKDSEILAGKNIYVYSLGKIEKVPGYNKAATNQVIASNDVNYLHWYFDTTARTDYLLATSTEGSDLTLEYIAPKAGTPVTTWTTIGSIGTSWDTYAGAQPDMENYLGKTFIVGYKSGTTFLPNATVEGSTFATNDTDITDMPQGKFIVRYRDLLYVLHAKTGGVVYPSRAYYSDEPTAEAIGWTNTATNFIAFGYDDGDEITGATEALDRLIVFKSKSMWKYDESERKKIADVGCDSYRSIAKIDDMLYFFNRYGFWRWNGAAPELISAKIQPYIDAIDQSKLGEVVASSYNGSEYRAFIGDVTVDDINYNNAWFCWDTRREVCYIRCTYHEVKSVANFKIDDKRRTYFGDNNGYVYKFAHKIDEVYGDDDNEIDSFFVTRSLDFGVPSETKFSNHITAYTKYAQGMKCVAEVDNSGTFDKSVALNMTNNISYSDFSASGNLFKYKFYEKSKSKSFEFSGFTLETSLKSKQQ